MSAPGCCLASGMVVLSLSSCSASPYLISAFDSSNISGSICRAVDLNSILVNLIQGVLYGGAIKELVSCSGYDLICGI